MAKKTKNQRRRSALAAKAKPTLKQRILRRAFRVLPLMANGFVAVTVLVVILALGVIGWSTLSEKREPKPHRATRSNVRPESPRVDSVFGDGVVTHADKLLIDSLIDMETAAEFARIDYQNRARQATIVPPPPPTMRTPASPGNQVMARYPTWDPQKQTMVTRQIYADGHEETVRRGQAPSGNSFPVQQAPNLNHVIAPHVQQGIPNQAGMTGRPGAPTYGGW